MNDTKTSKESENSIKPFKQVFREIALAIAIITDIAVDLALVPIKALSMPVIEYFRDKILRYKVKKGLKSYEIPKHKEDDMKRASSGKYSIRGLIKDK